MKMTNNEKYWKQRFIELEKTQNKISERYLNVLKEEYDKSLAKIEKDITIWYTRLAENNEISYINAKKLLDKKELKEFKWTVEEYIKKGKENAINQKWIKELENASARVHIDRLNAIKIQIQNELEQLSAKQDKDTTELLKKQYENTYYKSCFEIQKGLEKYWNIQALDTNKIEKVISKPWTIDNKTFSDRIWNNKEDLLNTLQKELTQATIRGDDIHKVTKKLEKEFKISKGKAGRLVMTESAFFSSAGQKECFNSLNVKQYEIVATLDSHTSEICQKLDGKVFDMKDYEVGITAPPFHCWCRSCTAPYFSDEFTEGEKRVYRDEEGKTQYIDSKIKYSEWKEKYVTNNNKSTIIKEKSKKTIKSAKTLKLQNKKDEHFIANGKNLVGKFELTEDEEYDDGGINRIMNLQGYKGKPRIVGDKEFEKITKESNFFAQRTYGGRTKEEVKEFQRQLYYDDWYIDCTVGGSQYGKGMYCAASYDLSNTKNINGILEESKHYRKLSHQRKNQYTITEDFTIDKTAKVIKFNKVTQEYMKQIGKNDNWTNEENNIYIKYNEVNNKKIEAYINYISNLRNNDINTKILADYMRYENEEIKIKSQFTTKMNESYKKMDNKDISTLAVEMGYDAINAEGHGESGSYTIILNRTKLIIRKGGKLYEK